MDPVSIQAVVVPAKNTKDLENMSETKKHPFLQFQQTSAQKSTSVGSNGEADQLSVEDDSSLELFDADGASFWDVLASFSMLVLWFQRSTFGAVGLIRSLVLGHCLHLLFSTTMAKTSASSNNNNNNHLTLDSQNHEGVRKYFYLMQSLWLGSVSTAPNPSSSPHKQLNGAWPPPALVALAALTILALVVHPDGLTWIMLRKIR